MTLQFSEDDLLHEFGAKTVEKGEFLWLDDRVRQVEVSAGGAHISGSVAGSRPQPYSQTIMLASNGRSITIKGYCSCPVGTNCKHVAAVLLQHLELLEMDNASPVTATAPKQYDTSGVAQQRRKCRRSARWSHGPRSPRRLRIGSIVWRPQRSRPARSDRPINPNDRQLRYVLNHENSTGGSALPRIRPMTVRLRKDGSIADEKEYDPENVTRPKEQRARFLTEADCNHLSDLLWAKRTRGNFGQSDISLGPDAVSLAILMALARSGRLRFGGPSGPVICEGPARRAEARWIKTGRNEQRLTFVAAPPAAAPVGDTENCGRRYPPESLRPCAFARSPALCRPDGRANRASSKPTSRRTSPWKSPVRRRSQCRNCPS